MITIHVQINIQMHRYFSELVMLIAVVLLIILLLGECGLSYANNLCLHPIVLLYNKKMFKSIAVMFIIHFGKRDNSSIYLTF